MLLHLDPNSQLVIALNYLLAQYSTIDKTTVYTYPLCALVSSQLLSKQKHVSQISLELEKYNLENQYTDISSRQHSSPLS